MHNYLRQVNFTPVRATKLFSGITEGMEHPRARLLSDVAREMHRLFTITIVSVVAPSLSSMAIP